MIRFCFKHAYIMVIFLFLFIFSLSTAFQSKYDKLWELYKMKHHKQYGPTEEPRRRLTWERNLEMIYEHNAEADLGLHTYTLGVNEHTDKEKDEYDSSMKGYIKPNRMRDSVWDIKAHPSFVVPSKVDWRRRGYVTPIKNQKKCGGCYAFAAAGALEGQMKAATGRLVSLSEQNIIDCSFAQGNKGCAHGAPQYAFQYIIDNLGLNSEREYPYKARVGECRYDWTNVVAVAREFIRIPMRNETSLLYAVATIGPIATAMDTHYHDFMHYKNGVYNNEHCADRLDHAVLIVGYGSEDGKDYWIIKNSWGTSWGMKGYGYIARNRGNMCGIASDAVFPLV